MHNVRSQITKLVPRQLHGLLFECARQCRTTLFGIPDPYCDLKRLSASLLADGALDIGAHVGNTAKILRKILPDIPLHCFEPTDRTFATLKNNLSGLSEVHLHQIALGDSNGHADFFINANEQTNSLLDNDIDNVRFVGESTRHLNTTTVTVRTLDDWFAASGFHPSARLVVKADIQGSERRLIIGGRQTFENNVVAFFTEVSIAKLYNQQTSLPELLVLLEDRGFIPFQFYRTSSSPSGQALWFDALWIHRRVALPS